MVLGGQLRHPHPLMSKMYVTNETAALQVLNGRQKVLETFHSVTFGDSEEETAPSSGNVSDLIFRSPNRSRLCR